MNLERLQSSIKKHEGCCLKSYLDTKGIWTVGWGRNVNHYPNAASLVISQDQADAWLNEDIEDAIFAAKHFLGYQHLNTDARQNAFIEMVFNIGAGKLAQFRKMLNAIEKQDWTEVAKEALNSEWAHQVGRRALTLISMFQTGNFPV